MKDTAPNSPKIPPEIEQLKRTFDDPVVQRVLSEVEAAAGYRLTGEQRASFLAFHSVITGEPLSPALASLKRERPKRYNQLVECILGATQNALAVMYYHHRNAVAVERHIAALMTDQRIRAALGGATIAPGNTLGLDAEYQGLVLSARRCLDYLARGLGAFFRVDASSFRELQKTIAASKPANVATALTRAHSEHIGKLSRFVTASQKKSIRDRIAHYEFIRAGHFNLTPFGLIITGGGEELNVAPALRSPQALAEALDHACSTVQSCVDALLTTFCEEVKKTPGSKGVNDR